MSAPNEDPTTDGRYVADLAADARVAVDDVERWVALGLLAPGPGGDVDERSLERARLLRLATSRGIDAEQIAGASERAGDILDRFVDRVRGEGRRLATTEAAERSGLDQATVHRLRAASGYAGDDWAGDDASVLEAARLAMAAGMPEDAMVQLVRVYADALGRVAEAESRLFHFYVHDRLRAEGLDPAEAAAVTEIASEQLLQVIEPTVLYFHRAALARAMREDLLLHLAEDVAPPGAVGQLTIAVLFVDLVGFTSLTDVMGDLAAADIVDRFSSLVRDEAAHCDGRVVKQIGDEFMLVFPHPRTAVSYALHLAELTSEEPAFPQLRIGVHAGPALYREADYLGATVNLAARVTSQAEPGQLVVTDAVHEATADLADRWDDLGERALKGVAAPVGLHAAPLRATGAAQYS